MKKRIILTIIAVILLLALHMTAEAEILISGSCGENITYTLYDTGLLEISGTGPMTSHVWNDVQTGFSSYVKRVTISEGVTEIPAYAFEGCRALESARIPNSVASIGSYAFHECTALTDVNIPNGITVIEEGTFETCPSLTDITIPDSVLSLEMGAFNGCGLTEVTIPKNMKKLGWAAFAHCTELTSVTLPEGLEEIQDICFMYDPKLKEITVPDTTNIGVDAFASVTKIYVHIDSFAAKNYCRYNWEKCWNTFYDPGYPEVALGYQYERSEEIHLLWLEVTGADQGTEVVVIPEGVEKIAEKAFFDRQDIRRVIFPDSLTEIGNRAFAFCDYIDQFEFPKNLERIEEAAFMSCNFLVNPIFPESLNYIGEYAFNTCFYMESVTIPKNVKNISRKAFADSFSLRRVILPEGLVSIGQEAFYSCENLTEIRVPDSVTEVGADAFRDCPKAPVANRNSNGAKSISKAGFSFREPGSKYEMKYLFDGDSITGLAVTGADPTIRNVTLPQEVTRIEEQAFYGCNKLESITIQNRVTYIGREAFGNCSGLQQISFMQKKNTEVNIHTTAFDGVSSPDVYCYADSSAESFAEEKGWNIILLDGIGGITVRELSLEDDFSIPTGSSRELAVEIVPASAQITWSSSNSGAVSVQNGVITAHAPGTAVITAQAGNKTDTVTVTAFSPVQSFELDTTEVWTFQWNQPVCTVVNKQPADAQLNLDWISDKPGIATVENGLVDTLKRGDVVISATDTYTGITASIVIHVCYPVTNIELSAEPAKIIPGQTANLTANVTMRNMSCVNHLVTFSSSNNAIATVDDKGKITGKAPGFVTITAASMPFSHSHPESPTSVSILFEVMDVCCVTDGVSYGHDWRTEYVWEENNTRVKATRVCLHNAAHTETETVNVTRQVTKQATCTEAGETTYTSAAFTNPAFEVQKKTLEDIPATGHDWNETVYKWDSDHTQVTATRICKHNKRHKETETALLAGTEITKEATCTEAGETTYTSAAFENPAFTVQYDTIANIPAKGHHEVTDVPAKEPTCTETGNTEGTRCDRCNAILQEAETIPMLPHVKKVYQEGKAATCTEKGCAEGAYCAVCGTILSIPEEIPMIPHEKAVDQAAAEPTCTEAGCTEGAHCAVCGTVLSVSEEIPKLGHDKKVDQEAREATCAEAGCTEGSHCTRCGTVLSVSEEIPKLPHEKVVDKEGKTASCTETGYTEDAHCAVCGTILSVSEEIPMLPHEKAVDQEAKAATCTEAGCTEGAHCAVCGSVISVSEEIQPLGHQWGTPKYHWAKDCSACTAEQICERDKTHVRTEEGTVSKATTPATETAEGKTVYTALFRNAAFTKQTKTVIIPKLVTTGEYKDPKGSGWYFLHKDGPATYMRPIKSQANIKIPDSIEANGKTFKVTSIWDNAFKNDKTLKTVTIGSNVTAIGKNAFASCAKLKTVKGAKNVAKIKDGAFSGCKALTKLPAMEKLQSIGANAFKDCVKLKEFTIGKLVNEIGKNAFGNCKALKKITVKTTGLNSKNVKKDAFKGIHAKATFKCPKNKVKDYLKLFISKGAAKTVKVK